MPESLAAEYAAALAALSAQRRRFAIEYLVDQCGKQAAIRAGYAAGSAHVTGSRLLSDAKVRAAIDAGLQARAESVEISAGEVIRELRRVAFADMRRIASWGAGTVTLRDSAELSDDAAAPIVEVAEVKDGGVRVRLASKMAALDALAKIAGVFRAADQEKADAAASVVAELEAGRARVAAPPLRLIEGRGEGVGGGEAPALHVVDGDG